MASVAVLLAEGFEEIEAVTIVDVLRRAGVEVTTLGTGSQSVTGRTSTRRSGSSDLTVTRKRSKRDPDSNTRSSGGAARWPPSTTRLKSMVVPFRGRVGRLIAPYAVGVTETRELGSQDDRIHHRTTVR